MNYKELVYQRDDEVDGLRDWTWIKSDTGAWDGPKSDWETSHKTRYFQHLQNYNVVVQAGGNQGMYPRLLARRFKVVYTFEPDPLNFYCLANNCQEDNIVKMQAALGCNPHLIKVNRQDMTNTGMHTVQPGGWIPVLRVDDLGLPQLDCLLLDVEGYELNILKGAHETIKANRPVIVCENANFEIESHLWQYGYKEDGWSKSDRIFYVPQSDK
jgi:FkbM family methyltransferase